jgi:hypothetical protein
MESGSGKGGTRGNIDRTPSPCLGRVAAPQGEEKIARPVGRKDREGSYLICFSMCCM